MPSKIPICRFSVADGFPLDCEELLNRCEKLDNLNYHVFCEVFKDMNFASAFQGRTTGSEIAELSEELVAIARYYMFEETNNFERTVAAVFLVYALVNLQPYANFAVLRLIPGDSEVIKRIEVKARRMRRLDVLMILGTLLVKHTVLCATLGPYGMDCKYTKHSNETFAIATQRPRGVFYSRNEELDVIKELEVITRKYSEAKEQLNIGPDRNLKYVDEKFADKLDSSLRKVICGVSNNAKSDGDSNDEDPENSYVTSLKQRALKQAVNPIAHLSGIHERKKVKEKKEILKNISPKKSNENLRKRAPEQSSHVRKRKRQPVSPKSSIEGNRSDEELNADRYVPEKLYTETSTVLEKDIHEPKSLEISKQSMPDLLGEEESNKTDESNASQKNKVKIPEVIKENATKSVDKKKIEVPIRNKRKKKSPIKRKLR